MTHRSYKHLGKINLLYLLVAVTFTLTPSWFPAVARASIPPSNSPSTAKLLSQFNAALTNVKNIEPLLHGQRLRINVKREYLLKSALSDQGRAAIAFRDALDRELVNSPGAIVLLKRYASVHNTWLLAKEIFDRANRQLKMDQETVRNIQRDLNTATSGGQSDMNRELGSMRLKLIQLPDRIPGETAVTAFSAIELASSSMNLNEQIRLSSKNPIASSAIEAMEKIQTIQEIPSKLSNNPFIWSWILK